MSWFEITAVWCVFGLIPAAIFGIVFQHIWFEDPSVFRVKHLLFLIPCFLLGFPLIILVSTILFCSYVIDDFMENNKILNKVVFQRKE